MASRDDLHLKFGVTAEAAQLLETSLGTALLCLQGLQRGWHALPQPEEARAALARVEKSTLGTLLKEIQKLVTFEGDLPAFFISALKTRNRLMHGFYERHNFRIQTDEGRDEMIADLEVMHTELFNAWQAADAISSVILLKMQSMIDFDNLDDKRLDQLRRSIEQSVFVYAGPELTTLIEERWPWLLPKLQPPGPQ